MVISLLTACKDDVVSAGSSALQGNEVGGVIVKVDTLRDVLSDIAAAKSVYTAPDSCLLGECHSQDFGTLKADLLTQFACPVGWVYPDASELDSVCLYIYYRSWYGDGDAPIGLNAYLLDKEPLCYDSAYSANVDIARFTTASRSVLNGSEVVSLSNSPDTIFTSTSNSYMPYICLKFSDKEARQLFTIRDFSSQEAFNKQFPGLYITSTYGASSAMYIQSLCITIHYHFTYNLDNGETRTMDDHKVLYSNSEVKQLCHYEYAEREKVITALQQDTDFNYILSPANIYAYLSIPTTNILGRIHEGVQDRTAYVNLAQLRIDVENAKSTNSKSDNWASPASQMLLVKQNAYEEIFKDGVLPSDTTALLASLTTSYNSSTAAYEYYYSFDMSSLFTQLLRGQTIDTLKMMLVPVDTEYTTSSSTSVLSALKVKQSVSATKIRSAKHTDSPMDVEIVYCGFNTKQVK